MKEKLVIFVMLFLCFINLNALEINVIDINEFENKYHVIDRLKSDFLEHYFDHEEDSDELKNNMEIKILQIRNKKEDIYIALYDTNIEFSSLTIYCAIMTFNSFSDYSYFKLYEFCKFPKEDIKDIYPTTVVYKQRGDDLLSYNISDKTLQEFKALSLNGAKYAPFYLYQYYGYKNSERAWYWLQIGAQNGNEKCQYEYGKYLLSKDDKDSKTRGKFWIKKAIFNTSKEAYELLKELGQNEK